MKARPIATDRARVHRHQWGMTLLELLVVIALMSVVGFMALSQVGDDLSQARYQDTENRLIALHRAIVGHEEPVFNGQRLFSGYAADNGVIPTKADGLSVLITQPNGFDDYDATSPFFDPEPDVSGYNNGMDGDHLAEWRVFKGWRGPYLVTRPGEKNIDPDDPKPAYRDGWGNQGVDDVSDALDFGWDTTVPQVNAFKIASLGRDGLPNPALPDRPEMYDADTSVAIGASHWMLDTDGWPVEILNETGRDMVLTYDGTATNPPCLRLSLLVYRNSSDTRKWRRLTSECVLPTNVSPITSDSEGSCIDGDLDGWVYTDDETDNTIPCSNQGSALVTFPVTGLPTKWIPEGRHLLLLVVDQGGDPEHDGTEGPDKHCPSNSSACQAVSTATENVRIWAARMVDFFPGATLPSSIQLRVGAP